MTSYEIVKRIQVMLLTYMGDVNAYFEHWSVEFCTDHIKEGYSKVVDQLKSLNFKISDLTKEQLIDIGFGLWSEKSKVYLAPIWIVPILKLDKTQVFHSISGESFTFESDPDPDLDTRFGLVAFGIKVDD